ncbi:MAG: ribosome biogenesis GTPase YlqF, partial [Psychrobacillus sp.]
RFLEEHYPKRMEERYNITEVSEDLVDTFDHIGKLRRCFASGGEIDYDQVAELIVRDIRNQQLGKLTFDFVNEYE